MKIIISPAKKMRMDTDGFPWEAHPIFLSKTEEILKILQEMSAEDLQKLWKCNDKIATENVERIQEMALEKSLTPAIFSYEGIQYRYMAPNVMQTAELEYIQSHLRILSGFYGLIRPFDGVRPYRLEMQAKLPVSGQKNLYEFWGKSLAEELSTGSFLLNLASGEYSKAVLPRLPSDFPVVTCVFGELQGEKVVEKGTMCKMARGQMVRWLAEHQVEQAEAVKEFGELDFSFCGARSQPDRYVFLK